MKVIMSDLWDLKGQAFEETFFWSKETTLFCLKDRRYKK